MRGNSFRERWSFLRAFIARPRGVGAVAPSSPYLAQAIAAEIDAIQQGPILELGPGTGALTRGVLARGIAPERLTLIEYDSALVSSIAAQFPGVRVIHGDAFDLKNVLGNHFSRPFAATVSGIPLLNYQPAVRRKLVNSVFEWMQPGAPIIQFSYGLRSPVSSSDDISVSLAAHVWRNLPPARVWVYRKRANNS